MKNLNQYLKFESIFRIIVAVFAGESMLGLLISIVQENIFGGISFNESPVFDLIFGGIGTFLCAFVSGVAAYLIVDKKTIIPNLIMSILITIESVNLILFSNSKDPFWFDTLAALSLLVGIWLGVLIYNKKYLNIVFRVNQ